MTKQQPKASPTHPTQHNATRKKPMLVTVQYWLYYKWFLLNICSSPDLLPRKRLLHGIVRASFQSSLPAVRTFVRRGEGGFTSDASFLPPPPATQPPEHTNIFWFCDAGHEIFRNALNINFKNNHKLAHLILFEEAESGSSEF